MSEKSTHANVTYTPRIHKDPIAVFHCNPRITIHIFLIYTNRFTLSTLWTIVFNYGRYWVIVHSRCISVCCKGLFLIRPRKMKKDRQGMIPNRSYDHILQINCDFLPVIVAITRDFRLFMSISIKNNHSCFVSKHEWLCG